VTADQRGQQSAYCGHDAYSTIYITSVVFCNFSSLIQTVFCVSVENAEETQSGERRKKARSQIKSSAAPMAQKENESSAEQNRLCVWLLRK
jgi:hypothetical protein